MIGVLAVFVGFFKTFLVPVASGTFQAPWIVYVHGAFAFCWVALFLSQALLIKKENWGLHMTMGLLGLPIGLFTAVTIPLAGTYQVERELAIGLGETAVSGIVGTYTASLMFLMLLLAGFYYRRRPDVHKRLMLLATIVLLWPAWFRFRHYFPSVPNPEIWFAIVLADSLIVISWIWDRLANGRVHPTLLYLGALIILEHTFEALAFDSTPWRAVARQLYALH